MHITYVKLKNGEEYSGSIGKFRPCLGWLSLMGEDEDRVFNFDDCESVVTPNERININSPAEGEDCDEMLRAKKNLDDGRRLGWLQDGQPYPEEKFEWEKKYE